jgi:hypothetical protein
MKLVSCQVDDKKKQFHPYQDPLFFFGVVSMLMSYELSKHMLLVLCLPDLMDRFNTSPQFMGQMVTNTIRNRNSSQPMMT